MSDYRLLNAITRFLDANYPCRCDDEDCPGNLYEAMEIVDIMRDFFAHVVGGSWVRPIDG